MIIITLYPARILIQIILYGLRTSDPEWAPEPDDLGYVETRLFRGKNKFSFPKHNSATQNGYRRERVGDLRIV